MGQVSRRDVLAGGLGAAAAAALGACTIMIPGGGAVGGLSTGSGTASSLPSDPGGSPSAAPSTSASSPSSNATATTTPPGTAAKDGSWQDTGPQPHQPTPQRLEAGQAPPQLVVISWDGAGESDRVPLLTHFRGVAKELNASMTLFLSGLYFLPKSKRTLYQPPGGRPAGSSAIPFFPDDAVHATIKGIGAAWSEGHEIGTHFNGHFCGPGGVGDWSVADWRSEISQAKSFVMNWRTNTGFSDLPPLPFDYRKELIGSRTPCLEGSTNLRTTAGQLGWRYDTSSTGTQVWPSKVGKLWAVDMQSIPFVGHNSSVISMDYNMMYNQSRTVNGDPTQRAKWRQEAVDSWMSGFQRAYDGNRAPLIIGNHFEAWNGGIYMQAVETVMRKIATYPDARIISLRQLCGYLDAQDPAMLRALRTLPIGTAPSAGWKAFSPAAA